MGSKRRDGTKASRSRTGSKRRIGSQTSKTRAAILDGAEQLMLKGGYAAVTYRSAAAKAGVTAGLVQYYFPSLDDLFIALLRRSTDRIVERFEEASKADHPLRSVWEYASEATGTALLMEFMALANRRKSIRAVIGEGGERVRRAQLAALSAKPERYRLEEDLPPRAVVFLMSCIPRMVHLEESFGTVIGHAETIALIKRFLDRVEPRARERAKPSASKT